jgi:hypothetical protein
MDYRREARRTQADNNPTHSGNWPLRNAKGEQIICSPFFCSLYLCFARALRNSQTTKSRSFRSFYDLGRTFFLFLFSISKSILYRRATRIFELLNTSAFIGTNPTDEPITSDLPVTRAQPRKPSLIGCEGGLLHVPDYVPGGFELFDGAFLHLHERAFNKRTWAETRKV